MTAVLTNRLGSSLLLGSEYVSLETWDDGARRLLTLKTSRRRLGGQPVVGASAPNRIDRCALLVHRGAVYRSTVRGLGFTDSPTLVHRLGVHGGSLSP